MISKDHILAELRRTAQENDGAPLGRARFAAETGIRETDWSGRYWARWSDAVREAGLEPRQLQGRFDDQAVLARLIPEIRQLGRMPTVSELRLRHREDTTFPSNGVFAKFGSKRDLASRLLDYCEAHTDCADVAAIVRPLGERSVPDGDVDTTPQFGSVYLLKAGRNYKLGRTNAFGRRERELRIQLPERAETVHVIATDDPAGIEAYWHARFADRRKNGEWFELSRADVKAFRRRKFM